MLGLWLGLHAAALRPSGYGAIDDCPPLFFFVGNISSGNEGHLSQNCSPSAFANLGDASHDTAHHLSSSGKDDNALSLNLLASPKCCWLTAQLPPGLGSSTHHAHASRLMQQSCYDIQFVSC